MTAPDCHTELSLVKQNLRTWAKNKPQPIPDAAGLVDKNLFHLEKNPTDTILMAQTVKNIANLERVKREHLHTSEHCGEP